MEKKPLTESQEAVLKFIKSHSLDAGSPPSYREIQAHFGYKAIGTVQDHVKALVTKGCLEKPDKTRAARSLIPAGQKLEGMKRIPIYGEIAAGGPREAMQLELGSMVIPATKGASFGLRVVGDSMIEVGILEGDHIIVEQNARIKSGDIIVALLEGETTVKRYVEKAGKVFLVPENRKMSPIPVNGRRFEIQGKVVGLQRKI